VNSQTARKAKGYQFLGAGVATAGIFLFMLSNPAAWVDSAKGIAIAAFGLGLSALDFIVAYRLLRRTGLPASRVAIRPRPDRPE
jgi:protein-S-isoprenylcysteine O-methyltransferase Ste14